MLMIEALRYRDRVEMRPWYKLGDSVALILKSQLSQLRLSNGDIN